MELLCIILIKKFGLNIEIIEEELKKYKNITDNFLSSVFEMIENEDLFDHSIYEKRYKYYENVEYLYDFRFRRVSYEKVINQDLDENYKLGGGFYEGYGRD